MHGAFAQVRASGAIVSARRTGRVAPTCCASLGFISGPPAKSRAGMPIRRTSPTQRLAAKNGDVTGPQKAVKSSLAPKAEEEQEDEEEEEEESSDDEGAFETLETSGSVEFHGSLDGVKEALHRHWVDVDEDVDVAWVPGSFELPVIAKAMAKSGKYDAVIAIGAVVRGSTGHYEAVVGAATSGTMSATVDTGVPVVFNVLTCDTMEQALDRAGGKAGNKGAEAAVVAVEMANLLADMRESGSAAAAW